MTRRVVLRADCSPDPRLASNDRGNASYWERADLVKVEREKAIWLLKGQCEGEPMFKVPVSVAFKMRPGRVYGQRASQRDTDNLQGACKPWLDALTCGRRGQDGIGLLYDDGPRWVRRISYEVDPSEGHEYTEIVVEEMDVVIEALR